MMYPYYSQAYGFGIVGMLMMILFWAVIIGLIVWAVRGFSGRTGWGEPRRDRALDLLKERYAKGEIDKAEFDAKKKDLES